MMYVAQGHLIFLVKSVLESWTTKGHLGNNVVRRYKIFREIGIFMMSC